MELINTTEKDIKLTLAKHHIGHLPAYFIKFIGYLIVVFLSRPLNEHLNVFYQAKHDIIHSSQESFFTDAKQLRQSVNGE